MDAYIIKTTEKGYASIDLIIVGCKFKSGLIS